MNKPKPTTDYENGQMMGMLVIIRMLKTKGRISAEMTDKIEKTTIESLSNYLQKPEEDIILLVDNELGKI